MRLIALFLLLTGCAAVVQIGPAAPDPDPTIIGVGEDRSHLLGFDIATRESFHIAGLSERAQIAANGAMC